MENWNRRRLYKHLIIREREKRIRDRKRELEVVCVCVGGKEVRESVCCVKEERTWYTKTR